MSAWYLFCLTVVAVVVTLPLMWGIQSYFRNFFIRRQARKIRGMIHNLMDDIGDEEDPELRALADEMVKACDKSHPL